MRKQPTLHLHFLSSIFPSLSYIMTSNISFVVTLSRKEKYPLLGLAYLEFFEINLQLICIGNSFYGMDG